MRSIIWKEIRENLKWAVLLMLAVAAAMAFVLHQISPPDYWFQGNASLLDDEFQIITIVGAAIVASLLGLLQTVPELLRDQWAFLVHRPMTRTRLFFGKVIAGLVLYGAVMFLPLLGADIWAATPGHFAVPFHWRMLLPGIADVLAGAAFYFAALLTGIRQARWYGSRALPFALAVVCEACVVGAIEFWQALLVSALSVTVLMAAAWGSFIASGQYRSQPRITKAALGIVLFVGISCIGLLGVGIVATLLEDSHNGARTRYYVDKEGRVLRIITSGDGQSIRSVTDLAGNPVDAYKDTPFYKLWQDSLLRFYSIRRETGEIYWGTYRAGLRFFRVLNTPPDQPIWYYVHCERLAVGYDRQTRRRIGTIGPDGFSPAGTPASQTFPDDKQLIPFWRQVSLLAFQSGVYHIDFKTRQVKILLAGTPDEPILGAGQIEIDDDDWYDPTGPIGVAVADRIQLFSEASQPLVSFAYHYPLAEYPNIQAVVLPEGGYAIWYSPSYWYPVIPRLPEHIVILSATGTEVKRHELPPITEPTAPLTWLDALWTPIVPVAGFIAWAVYLLIWARLGDVDCALRLSYIQHDVFGDQATFCIFAGVVLFVGAVFWALLVFGIARRYAFSKRQRRWWTLAGFLLGPAVLLTLLALREWPARIACASCGRKRLVDRERCEHCGAAFAGPKPTGTEIFDEPQEVNPLAAH